MVYNIFKKSKAATEEANFVYHGSYEQLEVATKVQAQLKQAGFRTRRNITAYIYRFA